MAARPRPHRSGQCCLRSRRRSGQLAPHAERLANWSRRFSVEVNRALIRRSGGNPDRQYVQERIAGTAMEMFASACVLSRWDAELQSRARNGSDLTATNPAADLFLRRSFRKMRGFLRSLNDNDDQALLRTADATLGKVSSQAKNGR